MKVYVVHYFLDFGPDCSDQYDVEKIFFKKEDALVFAKECIKEIAEKNEGEIDPVNELSFTYACGYPEWIAYYISEMEVE